MLRIYHLLIRGFIVLKNRSLGAIIHLPGGKINNIYQITVYSVNNKLWGIISIWDNYITGTDPILTTLVWLKFNCKNQSIDFQNKWMEWLLKYRDPCYERIKAHPEILNQQKIFVVLS